MIKRHILSATAISAISVALALPAFAQETTTPAATGAEQANEQADVVVINGSYARSLERAVEIKENTIGFSDSIVATDVANFPEQNLSEALQRIPGVV
ncbi:MAG: TonB-dependent receptor, partial [Burkholderiales bacterium]